LVLFGCTQKKPEADKMIIAQIEENLLSRVFQYVDEIVNKVKIDKVCRGRPYLFSDSQIIKCIIFKVHHRIPSYRELEWKMRSNPFICQLLKMESVPDYSTLARRARKIEKGLYANVYSQVVELLEPDCRISIWDSSPLRSSRYDKEAKKGKGSRLGWYKGYKFHTISSLDLVPLCWDITTANVYDSQVTSLLKEVATFPIFSILADAAYDSSSSFRYAEKHGIRLVTDVNMRKAKSIEQIKPMVRYKNALYVKKGLGRKVYQKRNYIERLFSILKQRYHLEDPRLFGRKRYCSHVKWVLLTYLFERLIDKKKGLTDIIAPWNR
jgi:hypothetical protein